MITITSMAMVQITELYLTNLTL